MLRITLPTLLALLSLACGASDEGRAIAPSIAPAPAPMNKIDVSALEIPFAAQPTDEMLCAGQISPEQMDALSGAGYRSFISLRVATEGGAGWEEAHAAEKGINFHRMPVAGAGGINEDAARELAELLDSQEGPTVLYCGSSNRVGALLGLKAFHVDGATPEEAAAFGKASGVTKLEPVMRKGLGLE